MANIITLAEQINEQFARLNLEIIILHNELTVEVPKEHLRELCIHLKNKPEFRFELLMDICGVDYSEYGISEWATRETTETGFSRGVEKDTARRITPWEKPRFAAVYHLLSISNNHRLRLRAFIEEEPLIVPSVISIWESANWFEREAFDLYGIIFDGHPDLRRILTDYGFIGHPFRKDFPLIGHVEPRYDAAEGRVVYEPVDIEPRTLVPKVIRQDNRYSERKRTQPQPIETKENK